MSCDFGRPAAARVFLAACLATVPISARSAAGPWVAAAEVYREARLESAEFCRRAGCETFCPAEGAGIDAASEGLGEALGERERDFDRERFAAERGRLARQQDACRFLARARVMPLLVEARERMAAARAALERNAVVRSASLAELVADGDRRIERAVEGLEEDRFVEGFNTARAILEVLDREVVDPCEDLFALAEHRRATGRPEAARDLYRQILRGPCLGDRYVDEARWALGQLARPPAAAGSAAPSAARAASDPPASDPPAAREPADRRVDRRRERSAPAAPEGGGEDPPAGRPPAVALTLWQSAWGDFSRLDELGAFAERNRIREVYLNPGLAISRKNHRQAFARLQPIVDRLRELGIARIAFLYAELAHDVDGYAWFLRHYRRELGIDTLVDDSEFTDLFHHRFAENQRMVEGHGLGYAAFITLETVGNSGVSDQTRLWALRTLDHPILMSYFGCTLEEQRQWLEKYLAYADEMGRRNAVSVAILMGTKKVGRELSCERELDAEGFQRFLAELDGWARRYRSYRGLVLENNRRLPGYDVAPRKGR